MKVFLPLQWPFFLCVCLAVALVLLPHAWALRRLYARSVLRDSVYRELTNHSMQRGWLLSDIAITDVQYDSFTLIRRPHGRRDHADECLVAFYDGSLKPCAD